MLSPSFPHDVPKAGQSSTEQAAQEKSPVSSVEENILPQRVGMPSETVPSSAPQEDYGLVFDSVDYCEPLLEKGMPPKAEEEEGEGEFGKGVSPAVRGEAFSGVVEEASLKIEQEKPIEIIAAAEIAEEEKYSEVVEGIMSQIDDMLASDSKKKISDEDIWNVENVTWDNVVSRLTARDRSSDYIAESKKLMRSLMWWKSSEHVKNTPPLTLFLQLITKRAPIELVTQFVETVKPNFQATNSQGENALHVTIRHNMEHAEYLLKQDPQLVKKRNHYDQIPLHYAVLHPPSVTSYYAWVFEKYENNVLALDKLNDTPLYFMLVNNISRFIEYTFKQCLKGEIDRELYCGELEKAVQVISGLKNKTEDTIVAQIAALLEKWVDLKSNITIDEYQARSERHVATGQEQESKSNIIEPSLLALANQHYSNPKFQPIVDSLVYFAVKNGRAKLLNELLPARKNATELNPFVIRALDLVLKEGRIDTLKIFIESYANPTVKNQIIKFTLHTLMKENNPRLLLRFILDDDVEKVKKIEHAGMPADFVFLLAAAVNKHGMSRVNKLISGILESNAEIKFLPDLLGWGIQLYNGLSVGDQKEDKAYNGFISLIKNESITQDTWEETKVKVRGLQKSAFSKASDRPPDSVKKSFEEKNNIVKIPLGKAEIEYVTNQYGIIKSYEEKLTYQHTSDLQAQLHQCALKLRRNPADQESKLQLISMLSEYMRIVYGVSPHDTQVINLLALLNTPHLINKRLAQIKSGEGKSLLIAMLSAYSALAYGDLNDIKKSEKVDIITASADLAVRDAEHYTPYYRMLGLEAGHNTSGKGKAEIPSDSTIGEANILYGTSSSFVHYHLETQLGSNKEHRSLDTVIVDEFDNSALDELVNFVIGFPNPACLEEIVREVLSFVDGEAKEKNVDVLKKHLKNTFDLSFPDEFVDSWIKAYYLLPEKKLGKSYVKENDLIKIVNYENSGELLHGSRWSSFLHCFLELRNDLPFKRDTLSHGEMSFIYYINKYKRVYGMTGTLGTETERKIIDALLQADQKDSDQKIYYDSPTHLPCQIKIDEKGHLVTDKNKHHETLKNAVKEKIKQGRPVHIICETIEETNILREVLKDLSKDIQVYNDMQKTMPDEILAAAGKSGAITITTNIGGRGSNIVVSPEIAAKGGLHVISTYLPHSKRIEEQNFMRTARHGQPGTYQYIVPDTEFSKFGIECKGKSREVLFTELEAERERRAAASLKIDIYRKQISDIAYGVQDLFFDLSTEAKVDLEDLWKEAITDILRIARKYHLMHPIDPKNIVNAEQEITRRMEKFWEESRISEWGGSAVYASPRHFAEYKKKSAVADLFARQPKESKETSAASAFSLFDSPKPEIKGFVADMDHTCLGIHTSGIALSARPEDLCKNFKGPPEVLANLLRSLHEAKIPIGIATFGTEIELVSADGVPYEPLFASGRKSIENHFAALLGDNWSQIINNIQAYQVENKKITHKIRHVLSYSEYVDLSQKVTGFRDAITEINNREKDEYAQKMQIQAIYDKLNVELDNLKKPTLDEAKLEEKKVLPYGKNPHLAQFKRELKLDTSDVDNSQIIFSEDSYENRALARYAGYQVAENVAKCDGLAWTAGIRKKIPSHQNAPAAFNDLGSSHLTGISA